VAVVGDPVALLTIGCCKDLWKKYLEAADLYGMDRKELQTHLNQISKLQISPLNPHAREFFPRAPPLCFVQYIQVPIWYPLIYPPQRPMWWSIMRKNFYQLFWDTAVCFSKPLRFAVTTVSTSFDRIDHCKTRNYIKLLYVCIDSTIFHLCDDMNVYNV